MANSTIQYHKKPFKVARKSTNTNSFGLYQLILISKDGEAYKTHASMYYAKEEGEYMSQTWKSRDGKIINTSFLGCEMTIKLPQVPKEVLNKLFQ